MFDIHTGKECHVRIAEIFCIKCHKMIQKVLKDNDFDNYNNAFTVCADCITINYNMDKVTRN